MGTLLAEPLSMGQETIPRRGKAVLVCPGLFTGSEVAQPAINMGALQVAKGISCHQIPAISVSPMEKFALTSFAAMRDPSMKAQTKEEFSKLDHETQAKLKMLSKDLVVRAAAFDVEDQPGITAPLGFFDPAGFTNDITESRFNAYRRAEIKHGRVCMQASLGMIVSGNFTRSSMPG